MNEIVNLDRNDPEYTELLQNVGNAIETGRRKAAAAINAVMIETYWNIGRYIVEFEQNGHEKADYGSKTLKMLAADLKLQYGKGFSWSNMYRMRQFYLSYEIFATVSQKLSWSHYVELLKIENADERSFYEKECVADSWGVRELKRQMNSMLYQRIALSTDKSEVARLAKEGQFIEKPEDIIKEPYVLEFTGLPELPVYKEGDLEDALVNNLSQFFLELGKGFTYVGRQQKMTIAGRTYKVDLVFYHRILKCFVLVDLKIGEVQHEDIGQMNFYLNYYKDEMNTEGDTEPIGLILGAYQDKLVMQYALQNITNQLFVSRYQLYLPDKAQLEAEFHRFMSSEDSNDSDQDFKEDSE